MSTSDPVRTATAPQSWRVLVQIYEDEYDRLRAIEAAARAFFEDEHECLHDPDPPCGLEELRAALEGPSA